jgi:hypothetical protein
MNWHRFVVASVLLTSSALPFTATAANAGRAMVNAPRYVPVYESVTPVYLPAPRAIEETYEHRFELFNNSQQDITYLHLAPLSDPDEVVSYGGSRSLAHGRAWTVNLGGECDYSLMVEYEDGSQSFFESVNTCDYEGLQLR